MSFCDAQNSSKHASPDKNHLPENSTIVTFCENQWTMGDGKDKKKVKIFFPP